MNLAHARHSASHNLAKTYFRLGETLPNARVWRDEGFTACEGDLAHPLCNFAAELQLDPWSARRLREFAESRPAFHVYLAPGDRPDHADELLERAGFVPCYELHMMAAVAVAGPEDASMEEAADLEERRRIARFMSDQFFMRHPQEFRRAISEATAMGEGLRLFRIKEGPQIVAAVMVCESPGIVGLYNLCVAPAWRERGYASRLVNAILNLASQGDGPVALQCEERLTEFYRRLGFQPIGKVSVFVPPSARKAAILG